MDGDGTRNGFAEAIVGTIAQPLLVLDAELRVELANRAFLEHFQVERDQTVGRMVYELGNGQWGIPELRRLLEEVLTRNEAVEDYRVEHDFEGLGRRSMRLNGRRMHREGQPDRILLVISDETERERLLFELEGRKEFAEKLIDSVREALLVLGRDLRVRTANQSFYDCFRVESEDTEGRLVYELGNGQWDIPELRELLERILPDQTEFDDFEVEHEFQGIGRRAMLLNARRLDHLDLILVAIRDVTERRRGEERQKALVGELQHRVKNILNNVRALAVQTRRGRSDLDTFMDAFLARLAALSRAQDLLVRSPSDPVPLHAIVELELGAVGAEAGRDYSVEGPAVRLVPQTAQAVAMTLHELTTNAVKYGALAQEAGHISISWRRERGEEGERLRLDWRETGVRIEDTEPEKGFGSRIIDQSLPHMLGGRVERRLHAHGAACRIEFPLPGPGGGDG